MFAILLKNAAYHRGTSFSSCSFSSSKKKERFYSAALSHSRVVSVSSQRCTTPRHNRFPASPPNAQLPEFVYSEAAVQVRPTTCSLYWGTVKSNKKAFPHPPALSSDTAGAETLSFCFHSFQ